VLTDQEEAIIILVQGSIHLEGTIAPIIQGTIHLEGERTITTLLDGIILQDVHQIITGLQHHQEVRVIQDHQVEVVRHLQEEQAADEIINPII